MMEIAIECENLCKSYTDFALKDINLSLPKGQVMGFIGPNGAGKSTTIRILMGLVRHDTGTVKVLGHSLPDGQANAKREIGYLSDDMSLYPQETLEWHMNFMRSIFSGWSPSYADDLLGRFDLNPQLKVKGMSHGQRVKSGLLLAFARFPKLLILDEPTTGLDPVARQEVLSVLADVLADEERTILFSSHNTQDVERLSDTVTFIDEGKLLASKDKEVFMDQWRRIRLQVPEGYQAPIDVGVKHLQQSGKMAVATVSEFSPNLPSLFEANGASVLAVEPLTLEEIFLTEISVNRGRALV